MIIEPVPTNFRTVATSTFVEVPQFQRPYSWKAEHIEEFWDDLVAVKGEDYFVGTVVMYKHGTDSQALYITDGQQRFTTLTILLCAIRDICRTAKLDGLANGIHNLVERKDIDDKNRFFLKYGNNNKFLSGQILAEKEKIVCDANSDEEKSQKRAYDILRKKLLAYVEATFGTNWQNHEKLKSELSTIRDTILGVQFITLTLGNEEDAYSVFETLNSRGLDLEVSDLLKNLFSKYIKPKNKELTPVSDAWDEIRGLFESTTNKINFDGFLLHYWLASKKNVSRKNLFKEIKVTIKRTEAGDWLEDIKKASESYARIASPADFDWNKNALPVQLSLEAINKFSVSQARPLLLSIIRQFFEWDNVTLRQLRKSVGVIENFAFQFNAITQSRGGGGISGMYSNLARQCHDVKTKDQFSQFSKNMIEKFREREISREEFIVNFKQLHYSNENPKDRTLVRYILRKFHAELTSHSSQDYNTYTIEHLNPQSGGLAEATYGNIGNMTFLPSDLNEKLGSKPFDQKKKQILKEKHGDGFFDSWSSASNDDIASRSQAMAELAFDKIWKL